MRRRKAPAFRSRSAWSSRRAFIPSPNFPAASMRSTMPRSGRRCPAASPRSVSMTASSVKAGDILFVIDPRPYQAAVAKAEADLATATTNVTFTKAERERGSQLIKNNTLSLETFDQRVNAEAVAQASVQSAQAALEPAKLNLDYAYVKAPISGRISRAEITLGNLVGSPTTAPQLADLHRFRQRRLCRFRGRRADLSRSACATTARRQDQEQKIPVDVVAARRRATMSITATSRASTIASTPARARSAPAPASPMPTARLVPGMFVSVRMGGGAIDDALAGAGKRHRQRPEQALRLRRRLGTTRPNTARCTLGPQVDGQRVVLSGLQSRRPRHPRSACSGSRPARPSAPQSGDHSRQQLTVKATSALPG